jgi:Asp-tRNA(Asn)/Glu-tRNA(Gln) amidotransferase A subunit family amidase
VAALARRLADAGIAVVHAQSPVPAEEIIENHRALLLAELGRSHGRLPRDRVHPSLAADIDAGLAVPEAEYLARLARLPRMRRAFWTGFGPQDLLLMPATPDVAPSDGTTGDARFVMVTTSLAGPVATLRAGRAADTGMPVGALLFAAPGSDARLAAFLLSDTGTRLGL